MQVVEGAATCLPQTHPAPVVYTWLLCGQYSACFQLLQNLLWATSCRGYVALVEFCFCGAGNDLQSSFKLWAEEKEETFFKPAKQAFAERMSATRQASKIKPKEVRLVLQQLNFELTPYAEQDTVEALLGAEPAEDEPFFWCESRYVCSCFFLTWRTF